MTSESAYIRDERTGRHVANPNYNKTKIVETAVVAEETKVEEPTVQEEETVESTEVFATAEESANENVTVEVPEKVKKARAKKN